MAFKILPFGGQRWAGDYADHDDIRQYLGFKARTKLPIDFSTVTTVPLVGGGATVLEVRPGTSAPEGNWRWRFKSSKHRCFAVCPSCGHKVPAGRTHQHKC
jgi:hypothetical protein